MELHISRSATMPCHHPHNTHIPSLGRINLTLLRRPTQHARERRLTPPHGLHPRIVVLAALEPRQPLRVLHLDLLHPRHLALQPPGVVVAAVRGERLALRIHRSGDHMRLPTSVFAQPTRFLPAQRRSRSRATYLFLFPPLSLSLSLSLSPSASPLKLQVPLFHQHPSAQQRQAPRADVWLSRHKIFLPAQS